MAEFKLRINMENAAFRDEYEEAEGRQGWRRELNVLLNRVAQAVAVGRAQGILRDSNGNRVGEWEVA